MNTTYTAMKSDIRKYIKKVRNSLSENERNEKSLIISNKLLLSDLYRNSDDILLYMSAYSEVNTSLIFEEALKAGKRVYFPKVYGKNMEFIRVYSYDDFSEGSYKIPEPVSDDICDITEGLMVMPGVAFDKAGGRIGYGGGYYDRYLMTHEKLITCAICFDCQIVEYIPGEAHDISPRLIFTETKVIDLS